MPSDHGAIRRWLTAAARSYRAPTSSTRPAQREVSRTQSEGSDMRPIWEVILDNMKDVPPEDLAQLPKDGATEIDHYLYGHPKRNQ